MSILTSWYLMQVIPRGPRGEGLITWWQEEMLLLMLSIQEFMHSRDSLVRLRTDVDLLIASMFIVMPSCMFGKQRLLFFIWNDQYIILGCNLVFWGTDKEGRWSLNQSPLPFTRPRPRTSFYTSNLEPLTLQNILLTEHRTFSFFYLEIYFLDRLSNYELYEWLPTAGNI